MTKRYLLTASACLLWMPALTLGAAEEAAPVPPLNKEVAPPAGGAAVGKKDGGDSTELPAVEVVATKVAADSAFGTKINTPLIETPQSISVVTRAELEARGVQNLNDAVSYTSGVVSESFGMDSRGDYIQIRGYSVSGLGTNKTYLDGLRSAGGGQWTGAQFDPFGLERVEIVKGPSGVLYGQVPPGGLLNVVSKRPTKDHQNVVGVQYGSHNTIQGTFDAGGGTEDDTLLFRIVGLARDGDSEVDHIDLRRYFVAPSLTWNIGEQTSLTLLTQYQEDSGGSTYQFLPQTGSLYAGLDGFRLSRSTLIGEPSWNSYDRTQYALGYQFEHAFNETLTFRQSLRYVYLDTDYKGVVTAGDANFATGMVNRRAMWGYGDSKNLTADAHLEGRFSTGDIHHTLLAGVDFYNSDWEHVRAQVAAGAINIYNPVYTGLTAAQLNALQNGTPQQDYSVTERQTGVYLQEQAVWGGLHATLGVRQDWYEIDFNDASSGNAVNVKPDATTWRAGLLYLFENGIAPYVSYTTSFDAGPYTSVDTNNNPLEKPVESDQWEVGLKYKPSGFNALFTASVFQITEENLATVVMASTDPGNPYGKNLFAQVGEARTRGVELEARVELLKGFDVIAAWTYLDTEVTKSSLLGTPVGNELPSVPEQVASLWLGYTFGEGALDGLALGAGTRYVGGFQGNAANTIEVPSHTLFDASVSYDFGKRFSQLDGLRARLSATNLTDKLYVANSTAASAAWYGSGRNISLSVSYAW